MTLYVTGDTLLVDDLRAVPRRFPDIDVGGAPRRDQGARADGHHGRPPGRGLVERSGPAGRPGAPRRLRRVRSPLSDFLAEVAAARADRACGRVGARGDGAAAAALTRGRRRASTARSPLHSRPCAARGAGRRVWHRGRVTDLLAPPTREQAEGPSCARWPARRQAARGPVDGDRGPGERGRRPWWCSGPAGASRPSTSSRPRCCGRAGAGPTVIVRPLLALMRNQVAAAGGAGTRGVTINSANIEEWGAGVRRGCRSGMVDVLLVSPERLNNPRFRDEVLPQLGRRGRAARRRRGPLRVRLRARLPRPSLPPHPHPAG